MPKSTCAILKRMWKVLKTYETEAEARVVESFLSAKGLDVQLLGTHSQYTAAPGSTSLQQLRLMVREEQLVSAREILHEHDRLAHLSIVNDEHGGKMPSRRPSVWISVGLTALVLAALARYLF